MCFPLDNHPNHSTLSPMPTDRPEPVSMTVLNYVSLLHSFSFSDNLVPSRSVPMLSVPIGREVSPQCSPQPSEIVESDLNCGKKDQDTEPFFEYIPTKTPRTGLYIHKWTWDPVVCFCFFFSEPDSLRTHGFWTPIQFGEQYNFTYIEPWCTAPTNCAQVGGKKKKNFVEG